MNTKYALYFLISSILLFSLSVMNSYALQSRDSDKNTLGLFLGSTRSPEATDFSYGLEYWRLFKPRVGMKFLVEHTPNSEDGKGDLVSVILLSFRVYKSLYIGMGPGLKHVFSENTEPLLRIEIGYSFALGNNFELAPDFSTDFIKNGQVDKVYGLVFAKRF